MAVEGGGDGGLGRLDHLMFWIGGPIRPQVAGKCPAGPGAGGALSAAGLVHSIGVVLEMHPRVADKNLRRRVREEPCHRRIGEGPGVEFGFIPAQVGTEGAIEAKHGACSQAPLPKGVAVFQTGQVKSRIPGLAVAGQVAVIKPGRGRRQERAGGQRRGGHRREGVLGPDAARAAQPVLGSPKGGEGQGGGYGHEGQGAVIVAELHFVINP